MTLKVNITPAAENDMKRLSEIAALCFPDPWSERIFRESFENAYTEILIAKDTEENIAGYLVLSETGDDISIDDIAVLPEYRRGGIAKSLLMQIYAKYPDRNFLLEVRESNSPAISLYKSLGFEQVGFRKRYYRSPDEGAVLMTKMKGNEKK
ncbi:MAG: ribosomal protein S18-alanine N-acetyltransferase [Ruminococcus sp.]